MADSPQYWPQLKKLPYIFNTFLNSRPYENKTTLDSLNLQCVQSGKEEHITLIKMTTSWLPFG